MKKILVICALLLPFLSFAKDKVCHTQATFDALEEVRDMIKHELSVSNKSFKTTDNIQFSIGKMRTQVGKKIPKGVKSIVWVPIKVQKSGETIWDVEQGFMYGDLCMRNRLAEIESGFKIANKMKKNKTKK